MALSSNEFDLELAKNTAGGLVNKAASALSGMNAKPEKIAANVYGSGSDQQAQQTVVTQQPQTTEPSANNEAVVALSGTPKIKAATVAPPPQQQPFKATLRGGMQYTADDQGNRTFTMGTPGQDGYGMVRTQAGSATTPQPLDQRPVAVAAQPQAVQALAGVVQPSVHAKTPLEISMENSDRMKSNAANALAGGQPRYMTAAEGAAHGIGWKGRLAKYRADVDTYNQATGNQVAMDLEAMREAGAGNRALLQAKGVNDANAIAVQRLLGENEVNAARIATEGISQQKGQLDINQAQNLTRLQQQYLGEKDPAKQRLLGQQLLTMQGKDPKEWQITTREETDPANPMITKKVSYAVNLQDPTRVVEIGGAAVAGQNDPAMQVINGNPAYRAAYDKASPEKQAEMRKSVNERVKQIPAQ